MPWRNLFLTLGTGSVSLLFSTFGAGGGTQPHFSIIAAVKCSATKSSEPASNLHERCPSDG